jgi:D-arginine dehydrogenase
MTIDCKYLVIGAGISGTAAAYELAALGSTVLLEMEDQPGYHSTSRSATLYTPNYGPALVRQICQAALPFFLTPPPGFADHPLLLPRGALTLGIDDPRGDLDPLLQSAGPDHPIEEISLERAMELCPPIRPGVFRRALLEPGVMDMDAAAIHQGFLRGFRSRGGRLALAEPVTALERGDGAWIAITRTGRYRAPVVVNASGAWADQIGALAGANPIGLEPRLRTVIQIDAKPEFCRPGQPVVDIVDSWAYFKPEAGRILASPGDETLCAPMDAYPDDLVVAELVHYLEQHTLLKVDRILRSWAGLRCFVADHCPVVGFDPRLDGFFWMAGQGGYGIMMSAVLGRSAAGLIVADRLPDDLRDRGIAASDLSPARCAAAIV